VHISRLRSKPEYLQEGIVLEVLKRLAQTLKRTKCIRFWSSVTEHREAAYNFPKTFTCTATEIGWSSSGRRIEPSLHQEVVLGESYTIEDFRFTLSEPLPRPRRLIPIAASSLSMPGGSGAGSCSGRGKTGTGSWPLGMAFKKKLSDYFVDEKVPITAETPHSSSGVNGEIVWVCENGLMTDSK